MLIHGSVVSQVGGCRVCAEVGQNLEQSRNSGFTDCICSVVQLLASSNQSLLQQSLACIKVLARHHHVILARADVVPALVRLLTDGTSACQAAAASALWSLSDIAEEVTHIAEALHGSIEFLLHVLTADRSALQLQACSLLANVVASSLHNAQRFAETGGVAAVASALDRCSLPVQQEALRCLASVASSYEPAQTAIVESMLPAIIARLDVADTGMQATAAILLRRLASNQSPALYEAAVHLKLLAKLDSAIMDVQREAADALSCMMTIHLGTKDDITTAAGIPPLIKLLGSRDSTVQVSAAAALCTLADRHAGRKGAIADAGGITALASLLESPADEVQQQAATAIQTMASGNARSQALFACTGCIPLLVQCIEAGPGHAAEAAAAAVHELSNSNAGNQMAAAQAGAIQALAALLKPGLVAEQLASAQALQTLMHLQPSNIKAASEAGVLAALVQLAESTVERLQKQATSTWQMLAASHPVVQKAIEEAGSFDQLSTALSQLDHERCTAVWRKGVAMLRNACCSPGSLSETHDAALLLLLQSQAQCSRGNVEVRCRCCS